MLEEGLVTQLFSSLDSPVALAGAICLLVAGLAAFLVERRFPRVVADWVSAVSGVVAAAGAGLAALAVGTDGEPSAVQVVTVVAIGLLAGPASRGLWSRVRGLLPPRPAEPGQ